MTTRMSMRERREKIAELVQNDPRVQACSIEFEAAQTDITDWHAYNDALCAMCQALDALDNLERDNLTVKVILMPVHEGPSEYEEEGEQ